jgi:selenocysteine-specific elongation factor
VKDLTARGRISGTDRLALPMRGGALDARTRQACDAVERLLRDGGLAPQDSGALQTAAGIAPAAFGQIVQVLVRERKAVRVGVLLFHTDALARLRDDVKAMQPGPGLTSAQVDVATFKERYGLTRKFAIPLLEWLDKERVTRRTGDKRIVL